MIARIEPLSCAKTAGMISAFAGLIPGAYLLWVSLTRGFTPTSRTAGRVLSGAAAIVILAIFYGVFGFLLTLIGARLYNLLAGVMGSIESPSHNGDRNYADMLRKI
jgi:hypothetical protein